MKTNRFGLTFLAAIAGMTTYAAAQTLDLPQRQTPAPRTTNGVPHVQIDVTPVPEISTALLDLVAQLPGVKIRPTTVSLPGALGFWITEDIQMAQPENAPGGREFAHLHPDGSLHANLPPELAQAAIAAGWAVHHPWADQRQGWNGFVMIYTPATPEERDVVHGLIRDAYDFATGR